MEAAISCDLMTISPFRKNRLEGRESAEERAVQGECILWRHGPRIKESKNYNRTVVTHRQYCADAGAAKPTSPTPFLPASLRRSAEVIADGPPTAT